VGVKALMFYLSRSVAEAITVAKAGGGQMILAAAFLTLTSEQNRELEKEKKGARSAEREEGQTRREPRRRDEACLTEQEGWGGCPTAPVAAQQAMARALCLSRLHPHTQVRVLALSSLFPD
jgi:hypothetical protein